MSQAISSHSVAFLFLINMQLWAKYASYSVSLYYSFCNIVPKEGHLFLFLFILNGEMLRI